MYKHIHIFGASGAGTTTIAKIVSEKLGYIHYDSDDYYWMKTKEPFTQERNRDQCMNLLTNDLQSNDHWILSGSVTGWGEELLEFFDLVIYVYVPTDIRIDRLRKREIERYGDRVLPDGDRYKVSCEFIDWASKYDSGRCSGRNINKHNKFLENVKCKIVRIENLELRDSVDFVIDKIKS